MRRSLLFLIATISCFSLQISGQTWSALKRLTWNSGFSYNPAIAIDPGNKIHVAWEDNTPGNYEIFYKRSSDGGVNWSGLKRLTWSSTSSSNPKIAVESANKIHVVWDDISPGNYEIFHKRSTDGGLTWSVLNRLTWNAGSSTRPTIAVGPGNVIHVAWDEGTDWYDEIFYKRSTNSGASWSIAKRLTWGGSDVYNQAIAVDSSNRIHIVWHDALIATGLDGVPINMEVFYKRSTNGGISWLPSKRLTWNTSSSSSPHVAVDSSNGIHVMWCDTTFGNGEIYYKRSTDGGANWSVLKRLTWNVGGSIRPHIAVDSSNIIHAMWDDFTPGNDEIFYKTSSDGGANWSGVIRVTWNTGWSRYPALAADSANGIHVIWVDNTPGNYEVFYKNRK